MDSQKKAVKILYDRCQEFLETNKHLYEENIKVIKYMNLIDSSKIRIKKINVNIYNYEQMLNNKYIEDIIKKDIEYLLLEKLELDEDIKFYNKKIISLRISEEIHMQYIYCQSDIRRYEKILLS
jgi:hypothetical protein